MPAAPRGGWEGAWLLPGARAVLPAVDCPSLRIAPGMSLPSLLRFALQPASALAPPAPAAAARAASAPPAAGTAWFLGQSYPRPQPALSKQPDQHKSREIRLLAERLLAAQRLHAWLPLPADELACSGVAGSPLLAALPKLLVHRVWPRPDAPANPCELRRPAAVPPAGLCAQRAARALHHGAQQQPRLPLVLWQPPSR